MQLGWSIYRTNQQTRWHATLAGFFFICVAKAKSMQATKKMKKTQQQDPIGVVASLLLPLLKSDICDNIGWLSVDDLEIILQQYKKPNLTRMASQNLINALVLGLTHLMAAGHCTQHDQIMTVIRDNMQSRLTYNQKKH